MLHSDTNANYDNSSVDVVRNNVNLFIDEYNYFGNTPNDIKGIILLYLINSITKMPSIEQIEELCSQNILYKYKLCQNIEFWKLIWTKNIASKIPDPEKLRILMDNTRPNNVVTHQSFLAMGNAINEYINDKNLKNYIRKLYRAILNMRSEYNFDIFKNLKFNLLAEKEENSVKAIDQFIYDVKNNSKNNFKNIIDKDYWKDIDFDYYGFKLLPKIGKLAISEQVKAMRNARTNQRNKDIKNLAQLSTDNMAFMDVLVEKGFDLNKVYVNQADYPLTLLGYSIRHIISPLFEYLIYNNVNTDNVYGKQNAMQLLKKKKKQVVKDKLHIVESMIKMLEDYQNIYEDIDN